MEASLQISPILMWELAGNLLTYYCLSGDVWFADLAGRTFFHMTRGPLMQQIGRSAQLSRPVSSFCRILQPEK